MTKTSISGRSISHDLLFTNGLDSTILNEIFCNQKLMEYNGSPIFYPDELWENEFNHMTKGYRFNLHINAIEELKYLKDFLLDYLKESLDGILYEF